LSLPDNALLGAARIMGSRTIKEMRQELDRLMLEQIESTKQQTFGGLSAEEMRKQEDRLKRIREVSADYLAALKEEKL
jgi:hypothetical protein